MTQIIKIIILVGSLLVTSVAIAANWVDVLHEADVTIYVEKDSIKVNGDVISYWEKWKYKEIQTMAKFKPFKSTLTYTHIDCKEKTYGYTSALAYDEGGNVVESDNAPLRMTPIPADSKVEGIADWVCKLYKSNRPNTQ